MGANHRRMQKVRFFCKGGLALGLVHPHIKNFGVGVNNYLSFPPRPRAGGKFLRVAGYFFSDGGA